MQLRAWYKLICFSYRPINCKIYIISTFCSNYFHANLMYIRSEREPSNVCDNFYLEIELQHINENHSEVLIYISCSQWYIWRIFWCCGLFYAVSTLVTVKNSPLRSHSMSLKQWQVRLGYPCIALLLYHLFICHVQCKRNTCMY